MNRGKQFLAAVMTVAAATVVAPVAAAAAAPNPAAGRPSSSASGYSPHLHLGSRGSTVARVQRILGLKATGVFDRATVAAVQKFQAAHRIPAVGYVGPATWAALLKTEKARAAAAKAKTAAALAAAKAKVANDLSAISADLEAFRRGLTATGDNVFPMADADRTDLLARGALIQTRVNAAAQSLMKSTTLGQVKALDAQAEALTTAKKVVVLQSDYAISMRPDQAAALLSIGLDQELASSKANGVLVDPAKEASARAAAIAANQAFVVAGAPFLQAIWHLDPFNPGSIAKIEDLNSRLASMPESLRLNDALDAYAQLMFPPAP